MHVSLIFMKVLVLSLPIPIITDTIIIIVMIIIMIIIIQPAREAHGPEVESHSGRGEDFLTGQLNFFTETAVTPERKVEKWFPRWEINRHGKG